MRVCGFDCFSGVLRTEHAYPLGRLDENYIHHFELRMRPCKCQKHACSSPPNEYEFILLPKDPCSEYTNISPQVIPIVDYGNLKRLSYGTVLWPAIEVLHATFVEV